MKKKIFAICLILIGTGCFAYPFLANYFSQKNASSAIQEYQSASMESQEWLEEELEKAHSYNKSLSGKEIRDPFLEGSGMVLDENYLDILNINGMMGYVEIPKIDVYLPIYHGVSDSVLKKGIGHLEGSALPIGGEGTHCVLTGHTGLSNAKLFTDLVDVEEGDLFLLHVLTETFAYEVGEILVIEPSDTQNLMPVPGKDYVTLLTCTPYGVNSHRLLVRGHRIDYTPEVEEQIEEQAAKKKLSKELQLVIISAAITMVCMIIIISIVLTIRKRRLKK